jgi:hypothetical protein
MYVPEHDLECPRDPEGPLRKTVPYFVQSWDLNHISEKYTKFIKVRVPNGKAFTKSYSLRPEEFLIKAN